MKDDKQLDYLIGVLYQAVLEPSRWREAIGLCCHYAGGADALLLVIEKRQNFLISSLLAGTAVSFTAEADYVNHYMAADPCLYCLVAGNFDEWRCCHQVSGRSCVDRKKFYQDFLIPSNLRYGMARRVDDWEDRYSVLAILRALNQYPFGHVEQLAAQRFSGHLQRALHLQRHTENLQAKAELGAMAIDALALPMLIVDKSATILYLNTAADSLLNQKHGGLICKMGKLSIPKSNQRSQLAHLITSATSHPAVGGGLFLQVGDKNCQLFATPVPVGSSLAQDFQNPLALVFVVGLGNNLAALQLFGTLYDLSPAELRVAAALLNGKSLETCAHEAKVSFNTVRTQLQSVFRKTGTSRQPELVAMLSQMPLLQR